MSFLKGIIKRLTKENLPAILKENPLYIPKTRMKRKTRYVRKPYKIVLDKTGRGIRRFYREIDTHNFRSKQASVAGYMKRRYPLQHSKRLIADSPYNKKRLHFAI